MSSSAQGAQGGAGGRGDKPQSLVKYIRKASKVFKRTGSSKESPSVAPAEPGQVVPTVTSRYSIALFCTKSSFQPFLTNFPSPSSVPPSTTTAATTVPQQAVPQSPPPDVVSTAPPPLAVPAGEVAEPTVQAALQQAIKDIKPSTNYILANHRSATTAAVSCALMEQKARSLFAKYGLNMLPGDWSPYVREDAQRVEKKIRLRVRRTCHLCSTVFGSDKFCKKCEHNRCKKCPRYPPKTYRDTPMGVPKDKGKGKSVASPVVLIMPSRFAGKSLPYGSSPHKKE